MVKYTKGKYRWLKWVVGAVATPPLLFVALAIMVYLPPVQQVVVREVMQSLSTTLGMHVRIDRVRLAFPLDLAVHEVVATTPRDTLLCARALRLEVEVMPLLRGRINVDGLELYGVQLDTRDLISDARVMGHIGALRAAAHGIDLQEEKVRLDHVSLEDAEVYVALSDTGVVDTMSSPLNWKLDVDRVAVKHTQVNLSLPGDSLRLGVQLGDMTIAGGKIDLRANAYEVAKWELRSGGMTYVTRRYACDGATGNRAFVDQRSTVWAEKPLPQHFATDYVGLSDVTFALRNLRFSDIAAMDAVIDNMSAKLHGGLYLQQLSGVIKGTSTGLTLDRLLLQTPHSHLSATASIPWTLLDEQRNEPFSVDADVRLGMADVRALAPAFADIGWVQTLPDSAFLAHVRADGNRSKVAVDSLGVSWDGILRMSADACVSHVWDARREGTVHFALSTQQTGVLQRLLPSAVREQVAIPSGWCIEGDAQIGKEKYSAQLKSVLGEGHLALSAQWHQRTEQYRLYGDFEQFPLGRLLPTMGIAPLQAHVRAEGVGLDLRKQTSRMNALAYVSALEVGTWTMDSVGIEARYEAGAGTAEVTAQSEWLDVAGQLQAHYDENWDMHFDGAVEHVDLSRVATMADTLSMRANVALNVSMGKKMAGAFADGEISGIHFLTPTKSIEAKDLKFALGASTDTSYVAAASGDMSIALYTGEEITGLATQLGGFVSALRGQLESRAIDHYALKDELPSLELSVDIGDDNPLSNVLRYMGYSYDQCDLQLTTHPEVGLSGYMLMRAFKGGGVQLDDVNLTLAQDTAGLHLRGYVYNYKKKNPNKFEAHLALHLLNNGGGIELQFADQEGNIGIDLGANAVIGNGKMEIKVTPEQPVIAFRTFSVNPDNHITFSKDGAIRADVNIADEAGGGLRLYGEPVDSLNDITLSLYGVRLAEVCKVLPYIPRLDGVLNSDFHVMAAPGNFSAMSMTTVDALQFEGVALGDVGVEATYLPNEQSGHYANAFVSANGQEVLALEGTYRSGGEGHFAGEALLTDFPLRFVNGFLTETEIALDGKMGGNLQVDGSLMRLAMNGAVDFDSAHVRSEVYGFDFRLDEEPTYISDSRLLFEDYQLHSRQSNNPLVINGVVDLNDFSQLMLDVSFRATDFELINSKRKRHSLLYGKAYADFAGQVKGAIDDLTIKGQLAVLGKTDMTYVLKDSPLTVEDRLHDLVQFVDFEDTATVVAMVAPEYKLDMSLGVNISEAARFHCDLSEDGENYVDIEGGGDFMLRMTHQGDMRVTGRFVANSGEMKYTLPVIPLKTFKLHQGSYIDFTGNVMNPTLNITATERIKATVTENDVPRNVAFDVGVSITQPLEKMGIEFIVDAPEDLAMQNQLATMTKAQRGKSAVGLLATGMFISDDALAAGSSGFKANNALNAFLQSEIQNIAGSALKTIDLSVGLESGVNSAGASTTDYSFQFAKRFWGNRISVVVGGKVSTGDNAENSAESFIDNVSVEYRLDKGASRYVRAFYDRGTHDPFEGQLMTTGVGLVLRRKTNKLGELFIFRTPKADKKGEEETKSKND